MNFLLTDSAAIQLITLVVRLDRLSSTAWVIGAICVHSGPLVKTDIGVITVQSDRVAIQMIILALLWN